MRVHSKNVFFSHLETTKAALLNFHNLTTKYGHNSVVQQFRYQLNKVVLFEVNQDRLVLLIVIEVCQKNVLMHTLMSLGLV